ncbi:TRAFAC clade GTPase domain-containing protein [Mucilaginibacter lappiensis]|uniref:Double-GTPase 1 domain-containing protein n=1 Tax=Mucilaginibacter lappiensis TaxID=354630 RepID=A0A841JHE8_9SPHI|nr:hypothetical protein [Mucilaginibacter lappiensis]MBB6130589.1 hypothetical protein [Mucilaginibacter lappiensis]
MNNPILLIGKPGSSKTVFLSQLYLRLQKQKSTLKLYDQVPNISLIIDALNELADGKEPTPTHSEQSLDFMLPIQSDGQRFDLICPEYGGEQVNQIIINRELDNRWKTAVSNSNNWLFFIRLSEINKAEDIADITPNANNVTPIPRDEDHILSDQVFYIELLQILLFYKFNDYHFKNAKVRLTVALTCWDELETKDKPEDYLKKELPLLHSFIKANLETNNWSILGLSAQQFRLTDKASQDKYAIEGPEKFGFLIDKDGNRTDDITQLIVNAVL